MIRDTTTDFLVRYQDGHYLCKKKVIDVYKKNHLNAYSFHFRDDALKVKGYGVVVKRICIIEE